MISISSEGDIGDCIYLACIISQIPCGPHRMLLRQSQATKARGEDGINALCRNVIPLLECQKYLKEVRRIRDDDKVDWASAGFRSNGHYNIGETLLGAHLRYYNHVFNASLRVDTSRSWLEVEKSPISDKKVVINRTARYRNERFPWFEIVGHYKHRLLFVGMRHEWLEFCSHFGYVDYQPTCNMLEVAQVIKGSSLFIGNQSSAFAISEAMKHPRIQETHLEFPDCIFAGDNVQHVADGSVCLPDVDGSGELKIQRSRLEVDQVPVHFVPPKGWIFHKEGVGGFSSSLPNKTASMAADRMRKLGMEPPSIEELTRDVIAFNIQEQPRFFQRFVPVASYSRVQAAINSAGITDHPILNLTKA